MKICYFGAFDPYYARNNFIRQALESSGCQVSICNVSQEWPTYRKTVPLISQYRRECSDCDVIVVAEFCQTLVPLAWLLGRLTGIPVVFDMVIGLYEASVIERRRHTPNEFAGRKLFFFGPRSWSFGRYDTDRNLCLQRISFHGLWYSYGKDILDTVGCE